MVSGGAKNGPRVCAHLAVLATCWALLLGATPASGSPSPFPGQLWGFGNNNAAQLGNEINVETQNANPPVPVALPEEAGTAVDAAAGGTHTLVITASGQAYAFGYNYHGQLGNSTYIEGNGPHGWNPVPALIVLPGQEGPVVQVAGGGDFSFVLTASGQLYGFGSNVFGQLGNETNINQITGKANPVPTLVALPGQDGPVVEVAAGIHHTLVLTASGQLYSFGANTTGQLGRETTREAGKWAYPTPTLVALPGQDGPVVEISAGRESSFAVTESGQLYSFGNNRYGELGYAENSGPGPDPWENEHLTPTLVTMPGDQQVAEVAAGAFHTLVMTESGQLYAFGKNTFGQLGNSVNNENEEANPQPTPVSLPGAAGQIVEIGAAYEDSFVLTATGRLYSFGWNWFAQLGRTTNNKSLKPNPTPTPAAIPGGAALETVAAGSGGSHTLAVVGMAMTTSSLPAGSEGSTYDAQLDAEGGEPPYEWSAKDLPTGLSIDQGTGELSGLPTGLICSLAQCKYWPTFTVTDSDGMEVSRVLSIAIEPEPEEPPGEEPGPGGESPPPGSPPQPPVEETSPAKAQLRIGRVQRTAAGTRLVVAGTIAKGASGEVSVKAIARLRGRRITVSGTAPILDGRWRVRLPLSAGRRVKSAIRLRARFTGSADVLGGFAARRLLP